MDQATFAADAEIEERHWWFSGRRRLFAKLVSELHLARDARILDAGTSTGTNLRLLRDLDFTAVQGVDISHEAIRFCAEKGLGVVEYGDLNNLPFDADRFDLVLATDIIEHLDDDQTALNELARVVKPGGHVLVTVPAFPALWGRQDEVAHHKRRYRWSGLAEKLRVAGLVCVERFHFNFLLFGPIWAARQVIGWLRIPLRSENDVNSPVINAILTGVFRLDTWLARGLRPPFGVSILALCQKPPAVRASLPCAA